MTRFTKATTRLFSAAVALTSVGILTACSKDKQQTVPIQTEAVEKRDIMVTTEGTGTVEPVDTVAVKSQASGLIMQMPVEVGSTVKPGDLIAQIDTRNLKNDHIRAAAAAQAAESTVAVNASVLRRADLLLKQGVITAVEHETAVVNNANARSSLVAAQTNLRVAQQNLEFATVRSEVAGTIISKSASVGTVAASALSNVGGGSTLVTIADLSRVRMRVLVNETDIAQVRVGQAADVSIDAMANRRFRGVVEKIEPQAVVQQSVTMFPVLVSLENADQSLLPGMNGEVTMVIQDQRETLSIPVDALRSRTELASVASGLGISDDSLQTMLKATAPGGMPGGAPGGMETSGQRTGGPGAAGAPGSGARSAGDPAPPNGGSAGVVRGASGGVGNAEPGAQRGRSRQGGDGAGPGARAGGSFGAGQGMRADGGFGAGAGAGGAQRGGAGRRSQVLFAFVKEGTTYVPRRVRIGATNYDYAQVIDGLKEGEQVVLLSVVAAQGDRNASASRVRNMTGSGIPGAPGAGGARGPRGR